MKKIIGIAILFLATTISFGQETKLYGDFDNHLNWTANDNGQMHSVNNQLSMRQTNHEPFTLKSYKKIDFTKSFNFTSTVHFEEGDGISYGFNLDDSLKNGFFIGIEDFSVFVKQIVNGETTTLLIKKLPEEIDPYDKEVTFNIKFDAKTNILNVDITDKKTNQSEQFIFEDVKFQANQNTFAFIANSDNFLSNCILTDYIFYYGKLESN